MGKMFLMCGMSGAGKTTFAKKFAEENGYTYLGIDDFYKVLGKNPYDSAGKIFRAWISFYKAIHFAEIHGETVVVDTNAPTYVKRAQFVDWFPTFEEHNLIYVECDDFDLLMRNNLCRDRVVPKDEMERMFDEFQCPVEWHGDTPKRREFIWDQMVVIENIDNTLMVRPLCNN